MRSGLLIPSLVALIFLQCGAVSAAEHCTGTTCVDVSTDPMTGKITIHVSKGTHGSTPKAKPHVRHTAPATPKPRPRVTPRPRPAPSHRTVRHRSTPKATPVPDTFATDQLTQLIPSSQISVSPMVGALVGVPLYFSTTSHSFFSTNTSLLGVDVGLSLHSEYLWNFGDGSSLTVKSPDQVRHAYAVRGDFVVTLTISWGGTWSAGGFSYDVLGGAIIQQYQLVVRVHNGPTAFHR